MTDTNNGWPEKPGVPLNPEKDDWHWVSLLGSDYPQIMEWFSDAMVWAEGLTVDSCALHLRYLGPVLTPEEVAALQSRVAELEAALQDAARVLHKAGEQFTAYANQHAAKGTAGGDQKAATDQQWAQRCFNAHDAALEGKKDE